MSVISASELNSRLLRLLAEVERQQDVAAMYPKNTLPFADEMKQIREFIDVNEYGLAYEFLVATIECHRFVLTSEGAISLLELGLAFGFKTEREKDRMFDRRTSGL